MQNITKKVASHFAELLLFVWAWAAGARGALCLGLSFRLGWLRAYLYTRGMGKSRNTQRVTENTRINYILLDLEVLM